MLLSFIILFSFGTPGSVLPLGKMEINPVASMVALTKSQASLNDEKPSLADLDTESDEEDSQGWVHDLLQVVILCKLQWSQDQQH